MAVPFVPCPRTAQVSMQYLTNGQKAANVLHFIGVADWTTALLTSLLTYLDTWESTHAAPVRCNTTEFTGAYAVDLSSQTGPWSSLSTVHTGGETDPPVANNVTLAYKLATPLRGKSFRGRYYWIGLTQAQLTADRQSVASATALSIGTIIDMIRSGSIPNSGSLVVRSIKSGGAYRTTGVMTPVNAVVLTDFFVDSQRRRLPGHNVHH